MVFDKLTEHFDWAEVTRSDTASIFPPSCSAENRH